MTAQQEDFTAKIREWFPQKSEYRVDSKELMKK